MIAYYEAYLQLVSPFVTVSTSAFVSLPDPAWITTSWAIINHQLPSRSGRDPRQHSEASSVPSSVPGWHGVEAFLASLQKNETALKCVGYDRV